MAFDFGKKKQENIDPEVAKARAVEQERERVAINNRNFMALMNMPRHMRRKYGKQFGMKIPGVKDSISVHKNS